MTLSELQNDQPGWSPKQRNATSDSQQASKPGRTDLGRRTRKFQTTEEYYWTVAQLKTWWKSTWNIWWFSFIFSSISKKHLIMSGMMGSESLKEYNIDTQLIEVIRSLCDKATSAVLLIGIVADLFRTTLAVWQGCPLLSPVLFNIFFVAWKTGGKRWWWWLKRIIQKALTRQHPPENNCFAVEDAEETDIPLSSVSIGGRLLCNLQFADSIDLLGGSEDSRQKHQARPIYEHMDE